LGSLDRIIHSGDIYYFSLDRGDFQELMGKYDPVSYILHPFLSIVGIRGYDYPLGAEIMGTAGFEVTGMGPNPQWPVLSLVLFKEHIVTYVAAIFLGFFVSVNLIVGLLVLFSEKINFFIKISLFNLLYITSLTFYLDIGVYEFGLIKVILNILTVAFLSVIFYQSVPNPPRQHRKMPKKT